MFSSPTAQEALVYVMVMVSAADAVMSDPELKRIGHIVRALPIFADFDDDRLVAAARECAVLISGPEGLDITLEVVREALPGQLCETAYALGAELAAADGHFKREEMRLLDMLRERLGLDRLVCAALERAAIARSRSLVGRSDR
ncbi:Tellurite resistance protein TerB [Xaviernesmea oryzae]|uniref:Tellurite resistance protein TerB n=1 Tax=Xaviernesmea oryzae TaxID=464029 RepID=A0A1Q9ASG0_9HYPH|nr:tellurite resistance TerB family protein [Xaviernesmea oryzae]OLP58301.1 Tellurite resistance protein TerB [Xaviernesmea oryzae]SEL42855.1 Tellurite resistance protein [Xaviernesmea oryzae]